MRKDAAELVALAPDVILTTGAPAVATLQQATRKVPIVFANVIDPVGAAVELPRKPIRGIFAADCCARAASGHAAAAPPSSVMNERRFIQSPRRRGRVASVALRGQGLSQSPS
jgi:hypothetical protein